MSLDAVVALARDAATSEGTRSSEPILEAIFRQEGEYWSIAWEGQAFRLRDVKGLHYIAHLLRHPREEWHVLDLARTVEGTGQAEAVRCEAGLRRGAADVGLPVLDAQARGAYKRRLEELRAERDEAERFNDTGRVSRARAEIEALGEQLAGAIGLGGRDRLLGSTADRARQAVTKRIKAALDKIGTASPALGRHLGAALVTGYFCAYQPPRGTPRQRRLSPSTTA
jgi:non-specific serine/threonine protein kinase